MRKEKSPCVVGVIGNVAGGSIGNSISIDRSDIVCLPVIIPADDLQTLAQEPSPWGASYLDQVRLELHNLLPTLMPQIITAP